MQKEIVEKTVKSNYDFVDNKKYYQSNKEEICQMMKNAQASNLFIHHPFQNTLR